MSRAALLITQDTGLNPRDAEVLSDIKEAVKAILTKPGRPARVTIRAIARFSGQGIIQKRASRERLPRTDQYIEKVVETPRERAVRILWHTAGQFATEGVIPNLTALQKRSVLSQKHYRQLKPLFKKVRLAIRRHVEEGVPMPKTGKELVSEADEAGPLEESAVGAEGE